MEALISTDTKRIVIVWIGRLGDMLIATPLIAAIRRAAPQAHLTLVTGTAGQGGAALINGIDELLILKRASSPLHNLKLIRSLRRRKADVLVDFNSAFSRAAGAVCRLARSRIKAAFERPHGNGGFDNLAAPAGVEEHMLDRYTRLGKLLGIDAAGHPHVECAIAPPAMQGSGPLVVVHPGNFKKYDNRWPEEKFVELLGGFQGPAVWLAGPGEREAVEKIASSCPRSYPVAGPLSIETTAALLKSAELFVGSATGSAHLAAAVGTKTLTFLAAYTKKIWMPKEGSIDGPLHFQLVSSSWNSCRDIPVSDARAALARALAHQS